MTATPQMPPALGVDHALACEGEQATRPLRLPKERPILFSDPMVRAILEGRKTQTRRVMKPQPVEGFSQGYTDNKPDPAKRVSYGWSWCKGTGWPHIDIFPGGASLFRQFCPYGATGNRLWVRESFALQTCCDGEPPPFNDGRPVKHRPADDFEGELPLWTQAHYRATDPEPSLWYEGSSCKRCEDGGDGCCHWKPSIHMPRWASRITLEVTGVRVERLHDITNKDAEAEGVERCIVGDGWRDYDVTPAQEEAGTYPMRTAGDSFLTLWRAINGVDSYRANPWVWVVEFKRVTS